MQLRKEFHLNNLAPTKAQGVIMKKAAIPDQHHCAASPGHHPVGGQDDVLVRLHSGANQEWRLSS